MSLEKFYYVYILVSSSRRAMYTGITNDLHHRRWQHRKLNPKTFAGRYRTVRLVYFEQFTSPSTAIRREKQIKGWTRAKKDELVRGMNPRWEDLAKDWGRQYEPSLEAVERLKREMKEKPQNQSQNQPQGPSSAERRPPQDDAG
jgi:putative endonuclease